jgi:hypothetical protein
MKTDQELYKDVLNVIQQIQPKVKVVAQEDWWLTRLLLFIFPGLKHYCQTIGYKIIDSKVNTECKDNWKVLAHEGVHVQQEMKYSRLLFGFLYLLPQSLFILVFPITILSILNKWFLFGFLGLLFLTPIPAYFRARFELAGYTMSMAVNYWRYGGILNTTKDWVEKQFTSIGYWFMWPFKYRVHVWVENAAENIISDKILEIPYFKSINTIICKTGEENVV